LWIIYDGADTPGKAKFSAGAARIPGRKGLWVKAKPEHCL